MDGKEDSSCTDGNFFPGLLTRHVCKGKPPDKAEAFFMAKKTTHTNQENRALLRFNFHVKYIKMVLLHLKYKILCS